MNIQFNVIEIFNFMSIQHEKIDLDCSGFISVVGVNKNNIDGALSNGSGKSSIFEALVWVLTGDTLRQTRDIVNKYSDGGTYVDVKFSCNDVEYELLRSKDHSKYGTNLKIYIDGEDKSGKGIRDSEKLLSTYLPELTPSLISSVIVLGQGLPNRFSNNTAVGRKEVLEKLTQSDFMLQDIKERLQNRKSIVDSKAKVIETNIASLTAEYNTYGRTIEEDTEELSKLDSFDSSLLTSLKESSDSKKKQLIELEDTKRELELIRDGLSEKVVDLRQQKESSIEIITDKYADIKKPKEDEINSIKVEISSLNREIVKLKSIKDVCPTCGQHIPGVIKTDTSDKEKELASLNARNRELSDELLKDESEEKDLIIKENNYYTEKEIELKQSIDRALVSLKDITTNTNSINNEIERLQTQINKLEVQANTIQSQREFFKQRINEYKDKKLQLEREILYNNDEQQKIQQHAAVLSKINTLVSRDFRGYLLVDIIDYLNYSVAKFGKELFSECEMSVTLNNNSIDITFNGKDYSSLSGGERQKIDIVLQFAIRDMLCYYTNFSCSILVLDEIFDNLDNEGCQQVVDLISKLNDVKTIFLVTHHKDLNIPVDKELFVEKDSKGISRINGHF